MPYCGLLINMTSLEITKDYSRYCGISISDTVSTDLSHHPGVSLQECLLRFLKPKCQLIFVDSEINTLGTIIDNVFNFFYLIACRFHTHICRLPSNKRVAANQNFFFECIEEIADYFNQQTHFYMKKMNGANSYPLNKVENKWLCFMAFDIKLSCHCSQYHKLRKMLQMYFTRTKHLLSEQRYNLLMEVKESGVSDHFKNVLD
ncbi:Hypothetical predicted protein [Octopus vulgaris]|uniref:Telomerase reverse transcriptase n=1 Tax=Octopus vulgaris TaxID=6645 RepID=A0AA36BX92_OCTVU|nr:Hypothetical predicted protein [Octopus vulgaris]